MNVIFIADCSWISDLPEEYNASQIQPLAIQREFSAAQPALFLFFRSTPSNASDGSIAPSSSQQQSTR
jgi:hypothetical protein